VNIAISDILLKTRFFGLQFTRRMYPIIGQIFAIFIGVPLFNAPAGGDLCEYPDKLYFSRY